MLLPAISPIHATPFVARQAIARPLLPPNLESVAAQKTLFGIVPRCEFFGSDCHNVRLSAGLRRLCHCEHRIHAGTQWPCLVADTMMCASAKCFPPESFVTDDESDDDEFVDDVDSSVNDDGASDDGATDVGDTPTNLPQPAVGRLSLYFRELHRLADSGVTSVNSRELGQLVAVSPAVVRRDLSALGTIGRRGVGYSVNLLSERIGAVLGTGVQWRVVLVGVGSLGDALLRYRGFERLGFKLIGAFDIDPDRVGTEIGGVEVRHGSELEGALKDLQPDLAILAVPAETAADIAGQLVSGGVTGILNFAPTTLRLSRKIAVVNVDLASELQRLAFSVQSQK